MSDRSPTPAITARGAAGLTVEPDHARLRVATLVIGVGHDSDLSLLLAGGELPGGSVEPAEPVAAAAARTVEAASGLRPTLLVEFGAFDIAPSDGAREILFAHLAVVVREETCELDAGAGRFVALGSRTTLDGRGQALVERGLLRLGMLRPPALTDHRPARPGPAPARPSPSLVLVAGLTASGKSTFARALRDRVPGAIWLDAADTVRLALTDGAPRFGRPEAVWVHEATRTLAEHLLAAGRTVIVDATALTPDDRGFYLDSAHELGARSELVYLEIDEATAATRLARRAAGADPFDRSTAGSVVRTRLAARLIRPEPDEADGFTQAGAETEEVLGALAKRLTGTDR